MTVSFVRAERMAESDKNSNKEKAETEGENEEKRKEKQNVEKVVENQEKDSLKSSQSLEGDQQTTKDGISSVQTQEVEVGDNALPIGG
jgi:hypothetical protein